MKTIIALLGFSMAFNTIAAAEPLAAFGKSARILFQGDSITDGNRGRSADPNHILGHGYVFLIGAKFGAAYPERNLAFLNRGISGNTVPDLEKRWPKDTLDLKPDVLSVLIGVNDTTRNLPVEQYETGYDKLLTDAKTANPNIKLVVGEPFLLAAGARKEDFEKWQAAVGQRREIAAKLAKKHGAAFVKFQTIFDEAGKKAAAEYWLWDGVHPTYAGHQLMADEWIRVVNDFWPAK